MTLSLANSIKTRALLTLILFGLLTACSTTTRHHYYRSGSDSAPSFPIDVSKIPDAVPKIEPYSQCGNPKTYSIHGYLYHVKKNETGYCQRGLASWYGMKFNHYRTSSGELYNVASMTAAHRTLPIPCYVQVTNLRNGKHVIVKINDRGPFVRNRLIDLSYAAAKKLDMLKKGTAWVEVRAIDPRHSYRDPINVSSASEDKKLFLQIASFKYRQGAERTAFQLKSQTHLPILIIAAQNKQGLIYRVVLGPVNAMQRAQVLAQLQGTGLGEPIVRLHE